MVVYRDQKRTVGVRSALLQVRDALEPLRAAAAQGEPDHDALVELLIDFGELEAGVADVLARDREILDPVLRVFRHASVLLGHALYHSWKGTGHVGLELEKFNAAMNELDGPGLPETVKTKTPEGYAYYAVYPEMYIQAAADLIDDVHPHRIVVIGLRSIGTSLSAVVAAALEERGAEVHSYTVRPRGHPFYRRLITSRPFDRELGTLEQAQFIVVDEGPGLSGSSMTSTAQKLGELGIPDERIFFFPSWLPDSSRLISTQVQARWGRHGKYLSSFEQVWIDSGRLTLSLPPGELTDLSVGRWRSLFYRDQADYPAVQPQHERRKYLHRAARAASGQPDRLLKFAGLGRYGRSKLSRARQLAEAGFGPRVLGLAHGFLISEFVPGRPGSRSDVTQSLLDTCADYIAYVGTNFAGTLSISFENQMEMIRSNTAESLGEDWAGRLDRLDRYRARIADQGTVELDGRMYPQDWIVQEDRYIKTDAVDHHDDHFVPGPQDIACDIAGTAIEFGLGPVEQEYLIRKYVALTNDRDIGERLPFYRISYLCSRLGYASLAAETLGPSPDGNRFRSLASYYVWLLKHEIARL